ncbi:MAG: adenylate/guanylate cyclase domain-containing protein, partial [Ignavibacteriaceae bacterium]
STLRMDFRLSIFTGLVASVEYVALSYYHINNSAELADSVFQSSHIFYLSKVLILFMCGVAAGFVSIQLKKRIFSTLRLADDRNKVINLFGQQVSPEIAVELLSQQEEETGVVKDVCIMFLDIRNFTSMVADRDPKEIVAYQNEIFGLVIEIINKHKGIINQFLGDGLMATFGAPVYRGNECNNAVDSAREIVDELNKRKGKLLFPTRVGIGIHYGEAVTGNVGSDLRKQYSITGLVVILASRIEQLNKEFNSQILISKEVLENINPENNHYEPLGPVRVKGRDEPVDVFKLA